MALDDFLVNKDSFDNGSACIPEPPIRLNRILTTHYSCQSGDKRVIDIRRGKVVPTHPTRGQQESASVRCQLATEVVCNSARGTCRESS